LCALITAIVKGTEPTIQWDRAIYVIALKMLVMEVVGVAVGIHGARFSQLDLVKPGVAGGRSQAQQIKMYFTKQGDEEHDEQNGDRV